MKVIGIDPAPSKKAVIYDGEKFIEVPPVELKVYLDDEVVEDTLICWDAPLTGGIPENFRGGYNPFYQRKIEQLINKKIKKLNGNKEVKGISTIGYAGCPHWAITQYCLGFPLINDQFTQKEPISFELITNQDKREKLLSDKKYVIEVHPALALWLWLKDCGIKNWNYKGNSRKDKNISENNQPENKTKIFNELAKKLFDKFEQPKAITEPKDQANEKYRIKVTVIKKNKVEAEEKPKNMTDDHLDAYIAWLLGALWLEKLEINDKVRLIGNENKGAMLLPAVMCSKVTK